VSVKFPSTNAMILPIMCTILLQFGQAEPGRARP